MTLTLQYAGRRIWKARKRPEWQDVKPETPEGKNTYRIAAKYEPKFARAWRASIRGTLPDKMPKGFRDAIEQQSAVDAFASLDAERDKAFDKFRDKLIDEYGAVTEAAGNEATKDLNKEFKINLGFTVSKGMEGVREAAQEFIVPVNPYSIEWMNERSLELVEDLKETQTETIQQVLSRNFEEGMRAELVYEDIKANIGLLPREETAVLNRIALLEEQGYSKTEIKQHAAWYRNELLKKRAERIARTETITAQARGRLDAWRVANESGRLPPVVREWSTPPPGPSPNRPCQYCIAMHGEQAGLNDSYVSPLTGNSVEAPPLHPHCIPRDSVVLARAPLASSKRRYQGDLVVLRTALGNSLACTPNHPILTPGGFIPASALDIGCCVIGHRGIEHEAPTFIDNNHEDVPAVVDEIAKLVQELSFSETVPVPISSEDFHGDGFGSDVAVIRSDGELRGDVNPPLDEHTGEGEFFICSRCQSRLAQLRKLYFFVERNFSAPHRVMRGLRQALPFFRRRLLHPQVHRLASVTRCNVSFQKQTSDHTAADSPLFSQRLLTHFSDRVVLDNIVHVDVQSFSGHVYNLQTVEGFYITQNIFSHNCRCTEVLVRADEE